MHALTRLCLPLLSIFLISSCTTINEEFQWLDLEAVPRTDTSVQFEPDATWLDLAKQYIDLKHSCAATVYGVEQLEAAQRKLKKVHD